MSAHTVEAYGRDARQFLAFLAERFGAPPSIADFTDCAPADLRAFLARRRAEGIDGARCSARSPPCARSPGTSPATAASRPSALGAIRAPKAARRLPRPLTPPDARAVATTAPREGEAREPWILARDAAVLALCYGAGLRISEALAIRRADAPIGEADAVTVVGKGKKTRSAPVIAPGAQSDRRLSRALPLYAEARGAAVRRRQGRPAVAAHRAAGDGADARRARPPRQRHAARASPFLRHPSSGPRRRSAHHPGPARPRLAVDDAGLYRRRQRPPARRLPRRPPAGVTPAQNAGGAYRRPALAACAMKTAHCFRRFPMSGKRIVFTGGSGKAGRHAVPHLVAHGYSVLNVDKKALDSARRADADRRSHRWRPGVQRADDASRLRRLHRRASAEPAGRSGAFRRHPAGADRARQRRPSRRMSSAPTTSSRRR